MKTFRLLAFLLLLLTFPAWATQTVILAANNTAATSSDVTVTSDATLVAYGTWASDTRSLNVYQVANSTEIPFGVLNATSPRLILKGAGTYRVKRVDMTDNASASVGVTSDVSSAGSGTVAIDQTTPGTTNLVAANITKVAGSAISQGHGTAAAAIRVELPTDGTGLVTADLVKVGGASVATGHGTASGAVRVELPTDGTGTVGLNAGSNLIGSVNIRPATSGGWSLYSANVTNSALAVDASPGQVGGWYFYNNNAAVCYVQLWNTAQGSVTVGTTAPVISLGVPANAGANLAIPSGLAFSTAITIAATTTRAGASACTNGVDANVWYF